MITPKPGYMVDPANPNGVVKETDINPKTNLAYNAPTATEKGVVPPANQSTETASTTPPPLSQFSSSSIPTMSKGIDQATQSAKTTMSGASPSGFSGYAPVVSGATYQYKLPSGQIVNIGDPTLNKNMLAGATYISGGKGDPLAQQGGATTIPAGYTPGTPDANGNVPYTNSQGKVVMTVPSGTDVSQTIKNVDSAQSKLGSSYAVTAQPDGTLQFALPDGSTKTIAPNIANDPNSFASAITSIQSYNDTKTANQSVLDSQISDLQNQLNQQLTSIETQRTTALAEGAAAAGTTSAVSTTTGQYAAAINDRFDKLAQQARDSFNAAVNTARSSMMNANTKAESDLSSALTGIEETATSNVLATQKFNQTVQQQAQASFSSDAKTFDVSNLPEGVTVDNLKLKNGVTGIPAVDALIKKGTAAGYTAEEALGLIQSGTLAQNKANSQQWLTNLKNFTLPDMSKMSLADAQKSPLLSSLISQGSSVLGTPEAAYEALQSSYAQQKNQLDLQKEQAQIAMAQINAALAPERVAIMQMNQGISEVQKATTNALKAGQWGQTLSSVVQWMPNIESAVKSGGKGVSALTLIDALVKIDTGGQAIRQGQTNLLEESGTWGDSAKKFITKLGLSSTTGANTQLTPNQVTQIYNLAKQTAAEKIQATMPAYEAYKSGVDAVKTAFPANALQIDSVTSWTAQVDDFIKKYGYDQAGGGSSGALNLSAPKSGDTTNYNGGMYKFDGTNWVLQQ